MANLENKPYTMDELSIAVGHYNHAKAAVKAAEDVVHVEEGKLDHAKTVLANARETLLRYEREITKIVKEMGR